MPKRYQGGLHEIRDLLAQDVQEKIMIGLRDILKHNGILEFYYSEKFQIVAWNDVRGVGHKIKTFGDSYTGKKVNIASVMKHGK